MPYSVVSVGQETHKGTMLKSSSKCQLLYLLPPSKHIMLFLDLLWSYLLFKAQLFVKKLNLLGWHCLVRSYRFQVYISKIHDLSFKLKSFCPAKETTNKTKRQPTEQEKLFSKPSSWSKHLLPETSSSYSNSFPIHFVTYSFHCFTCSPPTRV